MTSERLPPTRHLAPILLALSMIGCASNPQPRSSNPASLEALRLRAEQFSEAVRQASSSRWAVGEVASLADFYTPDAIVLPPRGGPIRGQEAIKAYWTRAADFQILDHIIHTERVDVDGSLAADYGAFEITSQAGSGAATTARQSFVSVWRRGPDGLWRKHLDTWW